MKSYQAKRWTRGIGLIAAVIAFIFLQAVPIPAQTLNRPPSSRGMSERDRNLLDRERQLREIERTSRATPRRVPPMALAQISEDYMRVQVVNNGIKLTISSNKTIDYKYISDATAEIKKRALRLKTNLMFPESANDQKTPKGLEQPDTVQLKSSLSALNVLIKRFVSNPVFTDAKVVDAQLAAKARHDLEGIIELSDKIRKSAKKLDELSKKP